MTRTRRVDLPALLAATLLLTSHSPAAAALFSENFGQSSTCTGGSGAGTYPFPAGWVLRNVDDRTPHPSVAFVNEAWEANGDLEDASNCGAFSTSYYGPVGQADDWMWIIDHTLQLGDRKCLVILGLRQSAWEQAESRVMSHQDVE